MGFYERVVFPRIMNAVMAASYLKPLRREALAKATGRVLEIGFGTGLNLEHYPKGVTEIVAVDPNPTMGSLARQRIARHPTPVTVHTSTGEALPFGDTSFDTVVTTFSLCTIPHAEQALGEVRRVLRPGGRLLFLEHGLADDPKVQKWQHRLNPINRVLACGCNLDRDITQLLQSVDFDIDGLRTFYLKEEPKPMGYLYLGEARPGAAA